MTLFIRDRNPSALHGFGDTLKSSDEEDKTANAMKNPVAYSPEHNVVTFIDVTIDDLGGRSDALGG